MLPLVQGSPKALALEHALCLTGDGLAHLQTEDPQQLLRLIPHVQVFARVAPKQKVGAGVTLRRDPGAARSPPFSALWTLLLILHTAFPDPLTNQLLHKQGRMKEERILFLI